MPLTGDHDIADVLRDVSSIALLGASANTRRPSNEVMRFLLDRGYVVYPVNPGLAGSQLHGRTVYATLDAIVDPIDMVDVFRNRVYLPEIVDATIRGGIKILWTQLDVIDTQAAERAEKAGIRVVMDRCPAIEWPRLKRVGLL